MSYRRCCCRWAVGLALIVGVPGEAPAQSGNPFHPTPASTLRLPPEPLTDGFAWEDALSGLRFERPVALRTPPGETNRLFVAEQSGRIYVITNLAEPTKTLFLDLTDRVAHSGSGEEGLLGFTFHPRHAVNGWFYIYYTLLTQGPLVDGLHDRLARFRVARDDPNRGLPETEFPLITQGDGDSFHNGGCLEFGPDGYLYLGLGDGGAANNLYDNAQVIDRHLFSGILRIDVDGRIGNLPPNPNPAVHGHYLVPRDNPLIGVARFNGADVPLQHVRTEFYAVGLRNPWQFAFDPATGLLFSNDVGQDLREEVNWILPGGNYGWAHFEGTVARAVPASPPTPPDLTFLMPPLVEYDRSRGNAIGAALVYRGSAHPQLDGHFLFSDFGSGHLGAVDLRDPAFQTAAAEILQALKDAQDALHASTPEWEAAEIRWESGYRSPWQVLRPHEAYATSGAALNVLDDGSVLAQGMSPSVDEYVFRAVIPPSAPLATLRLDLLTHPDLPGQGPGRADVPFGQGNFVLSGMQLAVRPAGSDHEPTPVALTDPRASHEQVFHPISHLFDENPISGWAIGPEMGRDHAATFLLAAPLAVEHPLELELRLQCLVGGGFNVGRFQVAVSSDPSAPAHAAPRAIEEILRVPRAERRQSHADALRAYFRHIAPELHEARANLERVRHQAALLMTTFRPPVSWISGQPGIAAMGLHPATGRILGANWLEGRIVALTYRENPDGTALPQHLSETGAFKDLLTLAPQPGIFPYRINAPFWSDHALKRRWFSLPHSSARFGYREADPWDSPPGAIWIKHFEIETRPGDPRSRRRLETRFLVRTPAGIYGVTYRWNDAQQDAELVPPGGLTEEILIHSPDGPQTQPWRYPARSECLQCHTEAAGFTLGFKTSQLHCPPARLEGDSQVRLLAQAGLVADPPAPDAPLPALAAPGDPNASLLHRVRSYLDVNCAYCHRPGGLGRGAWDGRFEVPLAETGLIEGLPLQDFGDPANRLVLPGDVTHSVLWRRVAEPGTFRMPPLGSHVLDLGAASLLARWITSELPLSQAGWNLPPTIELAFPASDLILPAHQPVVLNAAAADSDGTIVDVQLQVNQTPVASDRTSPFLLSWLPPAPGTYEISAQATDNLGATATSPPVRVRVDPEAPPPLRILGVQFLDGDRMVLRISDPARVVAIEASEDLQRWRELDVLGGQGDEFHVWDPAGGDGPRPRFLRIRARS